VATTTTTDNGYIHSVIKGEGDDAAQHSTTTAAALHVNYATHRRRRGTIDEYIPYCGPCAIMAAVRSIFLPAKTATYYR